MQIVHRITTNGNDDFQAALDGIGCEYEFDENMTGRWVRLEVAEDDLQWPAIQKLAKQHGALDLFSTRYTKQEVHSAQWLQLGTTGQFGFPQPEDDFQYKHATYDLSNYCQTCGMGYVQRAPFRLRAEPKQSHSQFLQMHWVFDAFFIRDCVVDAFAKAGITGATYLHPVLHKTGEPIESITQLQVEHLLPPALLTDGLQTVTCIRENEEYKDECGWDRDFEQRRTSFCGRVKYHPVQRGPMRLDRQALTHAPDLVTTHEYFGSAFNAFRTVLVSRKAADVILKHKWRGVTLTPTELSE